MWLKCIVTSWKYKDVTLFHYNWIQSFEVLVLFSDRKKSVSVKQGDFENYFKTVCWSLTQSPLGNLLIPFFPLFYLRNFSLETLGYRRKFLDMPSSDRGCVVYLWDSQGLQGPCEPGVRGLDLSFCPGVEDPVLLSFMCSQQSLLVSVVPDTPLCHELMGILPSPFQTLCLFPHTRFFSVCSKQHGLVWFCLIVFKAIIVLNGFLFFFFFRIWNHDFHRKRKWRHGKDGASLIN